MKFSIVTCTWNSVKTLGDTIDSVQSQDYPDIEHIFVDGGSTDGTLDLIAAHCPTSKVLRGIGGGISKAMNRGIEASTGDVIAHLHSDDYYLHPKVLQRVAAAMAHSGRQWLVGRTMTDRNGVLSPGGGINPAFSLSALASGRYFVPHPATFVASKVFSEVGAFDEGLKYAMDWDLWFRIARRNWPVVLDEALSAFREHAGSLSSADVHSRLKALLEEKQVRRRYWRDAPLAASVGMARYWLRTRRLRAQCDAAAG